MAASPSAQYSLTLRVEIDHLPGMLGKVASRDRRRRRDDRRRRPRRRSRRPHTIRDITVETGDAADWPRLTDAVNAVPGARVLDTTDRTFMLHMGGKIEVHNKHPAQDARRPLDGLHARRGPRLPGDPRRPRQGLPVHDQAQHGGGRLRRHRGPRPRRHRPPRGDAGDGGQGDAVQGVRRRRRLPDLPGHHGRRRDRRRRSRRSRPASAASTSRTSRRRGASRSSRGCRPSSTSPSSTTTSTAPPSWCWPRCSTR